MPLETVSLARQMTIATECKTAIGMALVSMLCVEIDMKLVDVAITGGATLIWWILPIMFAAGFMAAVPYNYWRLKAFGKACH